MQATRTIATWRRTTLRLWIHRNRHWLVVGAGLLLAGWIGRAVASEGPSRTMALGLGAAVGGGSLVWWGFRGRVREHFLAVEAPVLLLLASQLVFRIRDAEALAEDPLDTAGLFRVACVGAALGLGFLAATSPQRRVVAERLTTRPFRLYLLYIAVVFLGAIPSLNPPLTAYRGVELLTGAVVVAGAYRMAREEAVQRILTTLFWWLVALLGTVWLGVLVAPSLALNHLERSPIPWQLNGVFPAVSSNGIGTLGVMITLWSLASLLGRQRSHLASPRILLGLTAVGAASLILAQYRTGYVAMMAGLLVLLALHSRVTLVWAMVVVAMVGALWGALLIEQAQPVLLRGQSIEQAARLSSRIKWWALALEVWEESPVIGRGLLTGTRFEVLAEVGRTRTSTIHGTWVEALVGTGIVGVMLVGGSFFIVYRRTLRLATWRSDDLVPAVLLTLLLVRSATGSTFEVVGMPSILVLALALRSRDAIARPARVGLPPSPAVRSRR